MIFIPSFTHTAKVVAGRVLNKNPKRKSFSIKDTTANNAFYGFHQNINISGKDKGWQIANNGGSVTDRDHRGEVWIIADVEHQVEIQEVIEGE